MTVITDKLEVDAALVLSPPLYQRSVLRVFKAIKSYTERREFKTRMWCHRGSYSEPRAPKATPPLLLVPARKLERQAPLPRPQSRPSQFSSFACFAPRSKFRNPGNFCLWNPGSWTLGFGIQLTESGIPRMTEIQNPSFTYKESRMRNSQRGI